MGLLDADAYAGYRTTIREQIAARLAGHEAESAVQRWRHLVDTQLGSAESARAA
jgi:hypothetical protein